MGIGGISASPIGVLLSTDRGIAINGSSKQSDYLVMAKFIWVGSSQVGIPKIIILNAYVKDNPVAVIGDIRIYDATNGQTICEVIGISTIDTNNIQDMGVISNVSEDVAIWEIQGRITSGTQDINADSLNMVF